VVRAGRHVVEKLEVVDPSRLLLPREAPAAPCPALVSVYREANAQHVRALMAGWPGGRVLLWSLDGIPADLSRHTLGSGAGTRFELLNRLVDELPAGDRAGGLVVADDDFRFAVGSLAALVSLGRELRLDLWQPSHSAASWASFRFVRRRPLSAARITNFVEQGPVFVMSPRAQAALLPLPVDLGMGWGAELRWMETARRTGLRLGILDALSVRHLVMPGAAYDKQQQLEQLQAMLEEAGATAIEDQQAALQRISLAQLLRTRRAAGQQV
jgi:hypothetical protein